MPMTARTTTAPKDRAVRKRGTEVRVKYPSPALEPTHSPITAPMTLKVMAILVPEKTNGRAPGTRTLKNICRPDAPMVRIMRTMSGSVAPRPSTVLTTIGKKAMSTTTMIFGMSP